MPSPIVAFVERRLPDKFSRGAVGGDGWQTNVVETEGGFERRNVVWEDLRGRWSIGHLVKTVSQAAELKAFFNNRRGRAIGFRFKDWFDYKATGDFQGVGDGIETVFNLQRVYADTLSGAVVAAAASSVELDPAALDLSRDSDDAYNGLVIRITAGTGAGQVRQISDYDGATKIATVATAWTTQPDASSTFRLDRYFVERRVVKPVEGTLAVYLDGVSSAAWSVDYTTGALTFDAAPGAGVAVTADFEFDKAVRFDTDLEQMSWDSVNTRSWASIGLVELRPEDAII